MEKLSELLDLVDRNSKLDPFYHELTSEELFEWLEWECHEAKDELHNQNDGELESELWDVARDFFMLLTKLQEENRISIANVFAKTIDKISRRKSFLLENRAVTKEEAQKIRNEAKSQEGYDEERLRHD